MLAKSSGDHTPLGGFVPSRARLRSIKNDLVKPERPSAVRTTKPRPPVDDLTNQFLKLKQLRKQVRELEQLAAIERGQLFRCPKTGRPWRLK
jgi:hypothetical protein